MKKGLLFVAVISAFSFASCKKDRTCTCTETYNGASVPGGSQTITIEKAKKGDARAACLSTKETDSSGGVTERTCTLK